jgi:hypothetical protein
MATTDETIIRLQADVGDLKTKVIEATSAIEKVGKATEEVSKKTEQAKEKSESFFNAYEKAALKIAGYAYTISKVWDFANVGAGIREQEMALQGLAMAYGASADTIVTKLKNISDGQLSAADAIKVASKALLSGLSPDELYKLMEVASRVKNAIGVDAAQAFDALTSAVERGNEKELKRMGILLDLNKTIHDYAKANDIAIESLTAEEKSHLALQAVIANSEVLFQRLGNTGTTTADRFAQVNAQIQDFITTIQKGASYALQGVVGLVYMVEAGINKVLAIGTKAVGGWVLLIDKIREKLGLITEETTKAHLKTINEYIETFSLSTEDFISKAARLWNVMDEQMVGGVKASMGKIEGIYGKTTKNLKDKRKELTDFEILDIDGFARYYEKYLKERQKMEEEYVALKIRMNAEERIRYMKQLEEEKKTTIAYYDDLIAKIRQMFGLLQETNQLQSMGKAGSGMSMATMALQEYNVLATTYSKEMALDKQRTQSAIYQTQLRMNTARLALQFMAGISDAMMATLDVSDRTQFEVHKAFALSQAAVNTALGITQALATPPPMNLILASMIGAMGAAQIALIAAQTYKAPAQTQTGLPTTPSVSLPSSPSQSSYGSSQSSGIGGQTINVYITGAVLGGTKEQVAKELVGYIKKAQAEV